MNIQCPKCGHSNLLKHAGVTERGEIILCDNCKASILIRNKPSAEKASGVKNKIIIANPNSSFCSAVKDFLVNNGFEVHTAKDGIEALQFMEIELPQVALIDVALPGIYGFELCDFIRKNEKLENIKIILLASIYDKTKYKRMPTSIYGADDYIEMHHIPDQLIPKIYRLIGKGNAGGTPSGRHAGEPGSEYEITVSEETTLFHKIKEIVDEDVKVAAPQVCTLEKAHEEAKRLARIIASDIILYNQETVEKGIREGNLYELLKYEIKEGIAYYAKRVPSEVRRNTAYLKNIFDELVDKMKKDIGV